MGRAKGAKAVPKSKCKTIYDMYCVGVRIRDIAEYYRIPRSTVSCIVRRYKQPKKTIVKQGRPKKLSVRGLRLFKKYVLENCFESLHVIVARFNSYTGLNLSERSGRRYMKHLKLDSYIAVQKPFVSKKNLDARILWARTHQEWTLHQWGQVMFTDESCFTVHPTKNRLRVWRRRGTRLHQRHMVPTFKSGYQTVSV